MVDNDAPDDKTGRRARLRQRLARGGDALLDHELIDARRSWQRRGTRLGAKASSMRSSANAVCWRAFGGRACRTT
ncbi:hypothetical protein U1701_07550 [Sphingomonas sp. PB2P19]|uniref:hypothetical protein n=1 Tax=Sphingomonas rhamnosi TaxID=3096156 RepID=UPI002FC8BEE8